MTRTTADVVRVTVWPSTPSTPAHALDDLTWATWCAEADALAEHHVAVGLRQRRPPTDPLEPDLGRALDLVVLGRPSEAVDLLRRAGVHPPAGADDAGWPQLLLAAGMAAGGDDGAWRWLLSTLSQRPPHRVAHLLVAGAGDSRGDTATADRAWTQLLHAPSGAIDRRAAVRLATVEIATRPGSTGAEDIAQLVGTWSSALVDLDRADDVAGSSAVAVAGGLSARGDRAGARLLLRATAVQTPAADVSALLRSLTPRAVAVQAVGAWVLAVVAGAGLLALGLRNGVPTGLLLAPAVWLWRRGVPIPGLTLAESRVWRGLAGLSYDAVTDAVATPDSDRRGWYGVAGLLGAIVGLVVCVTVLPDLATAFGAPGLLDQDGGLAVWLVVSVGLGVAGYCAARALHLRARRRSAVRTRRATRDALVADAARCRCWTDTRLTGLLARHYAAGHLVVEPTWSAQVGSMGGEAAVARCPLTGTSWLVGPLGQDGRWLALRGPAPAGPAPVASPPGLHL